MYAIRSYYGEESVQRTPYYFKNNSKSTIYYYLGVAPRESGGCLYPDTGISEVKAVDPKFLPGNYCHCSFNRLLSQDTFCLFIFDVDTVNAYSWNEIKAGYKILYRYDLVFKGNVIPEVFYPPVKGMKGVVNIYPPLIE